MLGAERKPISRAAAISARMCPQVGSRWFAGMAAKVVNSSWPAGVPVPKAQGPAGSAPAPMGAAPA